MQTYSGRFSLPSFWAAWSLGAGVSGCHPILKPLIVCEGTWRWESQSGKEAPELYFFLMGRNKAGALARRSKERNKEERGRSSAQLWQGSTCVRCVALAAYACRDLLFGRHDLAPFLWKSDSNFQVKIEYFFPLSVAFYMLLLQMPDDNIHPCNCGMKWSRKCRDKRKNCFDLEAFVNDSLFGSRLGWFSSFPALHASRCKETVSGSHNLTRQHCRDAISIHYYQRDYEKEIVLLLSYE